jgi:hypothetical protein
MTRSHGLIGMACVCLFLASGCTLDTFALNVFGTDRGNGPVVAGSLDAVAASTQKTLSDMHLSVSARRDGDAVKLTSTTPGGKRFTLVLKARKADHGDETTVNIQWEKDADDAFWLQLAANLARPAAAPAPPYEEHAVPFDGHAVSPGR